MTDISKIRAVGAYVLVELLQEEDPYSLTAQKSGWYHSDGTGQQRIAYGRAKVLSVGTGWFAAVNGKQRWFPAPEGVIPGATVLFRGYLGEAFRPIPWEDKYAFLNMQWVEFIEEDWGELQTNKASHAIPSNS